MVTRRSLFLALSTLALAPAFGSFTPVAEEAAKPAAPAPKPANPPSHADVETTKRELTRLITELQRSARSCVYLRSIGFTQTDEEFARLTAANSAIFQPTRIIRRDEQGKRQIPGWPRSEAYGRVSKGPVAPLPPQSSMPHTIRLHRVLRASPEKIYRAFLEAEALVKWLPPNGFAGKVHHLEARVGGSYRMSFINFSTGTSASFGGEYLELLPGERIRHTDRFDDPNLPGVMETTIVLKQGSCGTEVSITQVGVPEVIPAEACYLGWQESLILLAKLVEAEIPD